MAQTIKTYNVICANSTNQVLDENVIQISSAGIASTASLAGVGIDSTLTPVACAVGVTQIGFAGSIFSPSNAFNLGYAPVAGVTMVVKAVPSAGIVTGY